MNEVKLRRARLLLGDHLWWVYHIGIFQGFSGSLSPDHPSVGRCNE